MQLVLSGKRVHFLEHAKVSSALPWSKQGEASQRSRWEGGRLNAAQTWLLPLLKQLARGRLRVLEPTLDLLSLPIGYATFLLLLGLCFPLAWFRVYALFAIGAIAMSRFASGSVWRRLRRRYAHPRAHTGIYALEALDGPCTDSRFAAGCCMGTNGTPGGTAGDFADHSEREHDGTEDRTQDGTSAADERFPGDLMKHSMIAAACLTVGFLLPGLSLHVHAQQTQTSEAKPGEPKAAEPQLMLSPSKALEKFEPTANEPYELGPGDEISLDFPGRPELGGKRIVGPDGRITLPLVGPIKVGDKTRSDAAKMVVDALSEYYKDLTVTVNVDKYGSNRIVLIGNVKTPGVLYFDTTPTLLDVIARGGLLAGSGSTTGSSSGPAGSAGIPERMCHLSGQRPGCLGGVAISAAKWQRGGRSAVAAKRHCVCAIGAGSVRLRSGERRPSGRDCP